MEAIIEKCPRCGSMSTWRENKLSVGFHKEVWYCSACDKRFFPESDNTMSKVIVSYKPAVPPIAAPVPVPTPARATVTMRLTYLACPACETPTIYQATEWVCPRCGLRTPDEPIVVNEAAKN